MTVRAGSRLALLEGGPHGAVARVDNGRNHLGASAPSYDKSTAFSSNSKGDGVRITSTPFDRDEVIAISAGALGFLADWVTVLVISRLLGAHDFGDFRIGQSFAFFCAAVVLLGGDRAGPRVLATPLDQGLLSHAWEYLRFYGLLGVALSCGIIAAVWTTLWVVTGVADPEAYHAVAIMSLAVPIMALGALAGRTLQTVGQTFRAAMPWRVGAPMLLLAMLGLWGFVTSGIDLQAVLWLAVLTITLIAGAQWIMVRRHALTRVEFAPAVRTPRTWLKISLPMMGAFLVTLALAQSDLYFLEWMGTETSVGHYAAAAATAHLVVPIQTSIVAVFAPLVGREIEGGPGHGDGAFARGQRVMVLTLVPVALVLMLAATPVMSVFGQDFQDAALSLQLLTMGNTAWAMAALSVMWLQYTGRGMVVVLITAAALVVDSVLNLVLIPPFGMTGAAAGTVATSVGAALAVWVARQRRSPARTPADEPPRVSPRQE